MGTLLGQRVRAAVKKHGLANVLEVSGVSKTTLYEIMRGVSQGRGSTLSRLAMAGVDLNGVFTKRNSKAA